MLRRKGQLGRVPPTIARLWRFAVFPGSPSQSQDPQKAAWRGQTRIEMFWRFGSLEAEYQICRAARSISQICGSMLEQVGPKPGIPFAGLVGEELLESVRRVRRIAV